MISPWLLHATPAFAQTDQGPAAIERTIPKQLPETRVAPTVVTPTVTAPTRAAVTGRFTLGAVHIEGATAISVAELSQDFEPFLATEVDETTLKEIAARMTARYRKAGYLLSYAMVPVQDVRSGIVRIVVVEGLIDTIRVEGAGSSKSSIEATAAPLLRDVPLRERTLERVIGLIRDLSGLVLTDIALTRSDQDARRHTVKIVMTRDRVKALAYADNRGADENGRLRLYSSASFSSLAATGDNLRVDLFAIPGQRFRYLYGQLFASVPLGHDGLRFAVTASAGDQYQRLSGVRIDGWSRNLGAQISYPLLRARALTLTAKAMVNDWRSVGDQDHSRNQRDRLRVGRIGLDITNEARTRLNGEFALSRGFDFDGMTEKGDPLASRPDASGRFTKVAFTFQVNHPLSQKATLQLFTAGQYSNRPLLSVEEFALGGNRLGRAFDFNALTGDRGIGGGLELGYRIGSVKRGPSNVELFSFVDGGAVFEAGSPDGVRDQRSLASFGVGSRFSVAGFAVSMEAGVPLRFTGNGKSARGFISIFRPF